MARKKIHGNTGRPKSRRHRERLSASGRAFWARAHQALSRLSEQESQSGSEGAAQ
jgi:hypothetical protein